MKINGNDSFVEHNHYFSHLILKLQQYIHIYFDILSRVHYT